MSKFQLFLDFLMLIAAIALINIGMVAFTPLAAQDGYKCGAITLKGTPCKIVVKEVGTKCHHHAENGTKVSVGDVSEIIYRCGATTAKGTPCKRRVKFSDEKCSSHQN